MPPALSHTRVQLDALSEWGSRERMDSLKIVAGDLMEQVKEALSAEGTEFADMNWDTDGEAQNIDLTIGMDYCVLNF